MKTEKNYSLIFRLWHWTNAIVILGLLSTVFLRKTFLSYKSMATIIQTKLAEMGTNISDELAKTIGREIRNQMWDWHYILGLTLVCLVVLRLALNFIDRPYLPLEEFKAKTGKEKVRMISYVILYTALLLLAITGLMMYYKKSFGLSREFVEEVHEFHEAVMYFIAIFTPLHVIGVFIAENTDEKGIVSNMIGKSEKN